MIMDSVKVSGISTGLGLVYWTDIISGVICELGMGLAGLYGFRKDCEDVKIRQG